ncbi:MAG: TetR/AcrR family transcriptional regulator [Pyrinomonadaceae bacterium]|nr:TetR/AcrR family transcriptional regulator [Pyrinomonadaceae bacterium]
MSKSIETQKNAPPGRAPRNDGSSGGRMAGGERRQQIVRVAMRLFSQRGFSGTTTREIAQEAGVSEAMVFKHFATKEDLYAAILDHKACAGDMGDACAALGGAMERGDDAAVFSGLAQGVLHFHEHDTDFARLLMHSALQGHELFQMFWERNVRQMARFLCGYIRERQQAGALRDMEPMVIARAFIGMTLYHSLVNIIFDPQRSLLDIPNERAAQEFTEILLHGVATQATAGKSITKPSGQKKGLSTVRQSVAIAAKKKKSRS